MTIQEEIREGIARRIHLVERVLLKVAEENSPINCSWDELEGKLRQSYLLQADDWMRWLNLEGVVIKVDRELPCWAPIVLDGLVAVEPLIKDDK